MGENEDSQWASAVFMAVMEIGVVRMPVPQRLMPVPVGMRLRHRAFVGVAMMVVVDMGMLVLDRLMPMVMGMPFGQMKPDAKRHQHPRNDELQSDRLMKQDNCDDRAKERREREISAGTSAAEMAQRQDEQHEAQADAAESDDGRCAYRAD